jgi:hypothetical protein
MLKKLVSLIRRILGRIKENMSALFLSAGVMLIPLGFYFLAEEVINSWFDGIGVVLGIICLIMAYVYARSEKKEEDKKYLTQLLITKESSSDLLTELKELRQELKEVNSDKRSQKRKP